MTRAEAVTTRVRSAHGSNYGAAVAAVDFPAYARLHLAGRLPIDRLVDERIPLDGIEAAFDAMRAGAGVRRIVVP